MWIIRCDSGQWLVASGQEPLTTEDTEDAEEVKIPPEGQMVMAFTEKEAQALRVLDGDFQREVLEKLGRLEAKMDMLVGNGQPGRMKLAEDRLLALERNDLRRTVIERLVNASIAVLISAAIALHTHWWK